MTQPTQGQGGQFQATSLGGPQAMGQPSYTPNAQGTLTPNVSAGQLAGSFQPGTFGGGSVDPQMDPNLQGFINMFQQGVINPAEMYGQAQMNQLGDQNTLQQMQAQYSGQQQQQQAGFSLANLGLDKNALGIQQGALARQMGLLPQQYGLQTQGFDLQQQQANYNAMTGMRDLNSAATARGAFTAGGTQAARGDINESLQNQLANLGLQRQGAALNYQEQTAEQQDSKKQLDIQSQRLGISGDEIKSRLDNALAQLGIGSQISSDQILAEQEKVGQGMISPYETLFADLYQMAGVPLGAGAGQ
jgi:hypothetical protein